MSQRYALLSCAFMAITAASAQTYCQPTFENGCFSWRNLSVQVAGIDWTNDGICKNSDHTAMVATMEAGATVPMTVVSGNWTGCAVWVDLNNDMDFSEEENLYYSYVGGDPGHTYSFDITIPPGTPPGAYRMRVIAPWGSDGFLDTNTNGYGPCGVYQYGNFDEFTVQVDGPTGMNDLVGGRIMLRATPLPGGEVFMLHGDGVLQRMQVFAGDGRSIGQKRGGEALAGALIDLGGRPAGVYLVQCITDKGIGIVRLVKD